MLHAGLERQHEINDVRRLNNMDLRQGITLQGDLTECHTPRDLL